MSSRSRRAFVELLGAAALTPLAIDAAGARIAYDAGAPRPVRVRTVTAGLAITRLDDVAPFEAALAMLERGKRVLTDAGYEVQTLRLATPPVLAGARGSARAGQLAALRTLDRLASGKGALLSIGPVITDDGTDPEFAAWAAELASTTTNTSFTVSVASADGVVHPHAAALAAQAMIAIAQHTPNGAGNFKFAAAAGIPAGTPFFPVAYHGGPASLAVGLESAGVVEEAIGGAPDAVTATSRLRTALDATLAPVERLMSAFAAGEGRAYLGIDSSPAPAKDRSIGAAIEAFTGVPFGSASTLQACAAITGALKSLQTRTCGYAGLMLPILEDPVLAARATEGRYGVRELLLYSSVCGTGLDLVPLPADTPERTITRLILDVAALATKLRKPLSARLYLVPGARAGETVRFTDPLLTDSAVLKID